MHLTQRLFACMYDPVMAPLEHGRVGAQRTAMLAGAYGHVLDLGAGTGANLEHLPPTVERVTAVEPDPAMRAHLHRHLAGLAVVRERERPAGRGAAVPTPGAGPDLQGVVPEVEASTRPEVEASTRPEVEAPDRPEVEAPDRPEVEVVDAVAEALPLPDDAVDVALATLVLCTVRDPALAVAELRRVLRPDGHLIVLEHVASHQPGRLLLQRTLTPAWRIVGRGCHLDRDTRSVLADGGFDVSEVVPWQLSDHSRLTAAISGVARPA